MTSEIVDLTSFKIHIKINNNTISRKKINYNIKRIPSFLLSYFQNQDHAFSYHWHYPSAAGDQQLAKGKSTLLVLKSLI